MDAVKDQRIIALYHDYVHTHFDRRIFLEKAAALLGSAGAASAALDIRRGTNVFNAGLIQADQLLMTNVAGRFTFNGGTLVTKTLLVAGETNFGPTNNGQRGAMLRAFDKVTGKEVGAVYLPAPQTGSSMTYMINGTQYLVVAIGGAGHPGELLAFKPAKG